MIKTSKVVCCHVDYVVTWYMENGTVVIKSIVNSLFGGDVANNDNDPIVFLIKQRVEALEKRGKHSVDNPEDEIDRMLSEIELPSRD